jgi:hypothetical protein
MFAPAVRAYGNVGVIGEVTPPANPPEDLLEVAEPEVFTDPAEARRRAPGALGTSIERAFAQTPGPTVVVGVRVASGTPDFKAALDALSAQDVQIVVLADTPLDAGAAGAGPIAELVDHVVTTSQTGGDGKERIGVAMLTKGATDPAVVTGTLAHERMVYIAHKSDQDAAAAVAGTIAGYEPHVSMLLKKVNITSGPFTPAEIRQLNGDETDASGPAGSGVNWLTDPALIPGQGTYLGEGYTGNPDGKKYIDLVRCIDHVSYLLKARLVRGIGNLRISRSGLRSLVAQMEAVLDPLTADEVIDDYEIVVPLLALLDKDPDTLTPGELKQLSNALQDRFVQVVTLVTYAGAIHRLSITLKFE